MMKTCDHGIPLGDSCPSCIADAKQEFLALCGDFFDRWHSRVSRRKGAPARGAAANSTDYDLFIRHCWSPYPKRVALGDGQAMGKGKQGAAFERVQEVRRRWGLGWDDLERTINFYAKHPNVLRGYVQAAEVFWGPEGHWLECWGKVKDRGADAGMDRGRVPGIRIQDPPRRDTLSDAGASLEGAGSPGRPPE